MRTALLGVCLLLAHGRGALADPRTPEVLPCEDPPPGMSCVPGGPFLRGSDDGPPDTRPQTLVWVQTFYMDTHEVTVEEYGACVRSGRCPKAGPRYLDFDRPRQPITGVSWYDAVAYCRAQGKHLPTEAQWEKAARGTDGRLYPWGNEPVDCRRAVIMDASGRSCGVRKARGGHPEKGRPLEVGSRPPGIHGLYDMVGNAWEWVADWHSASYGACGADCLGPDPTGPCGGQEPCPGHRRRVVRGGSWYWPARYASAIRRRPHIPRNEPEFHHFGFRCAASVEEARALRRQVP